MSFYQTKNKIIYRRYRMVKKVIWSFEYIDAVSFRCNIMLLINIISSYNFITYGPYECLNNLDEYYASLCVAEMYMRIHLELTHS